ncbi:iron-containing alcohol dehydrogenase [Flavobacterium gawalongense]|uniref:Iron-containing alcohol dehydrogenase n=1 Tax=Flavobacterium gawalongense TaxID=2594432 RepID=A0A553BFE9_9FLAO|nr:iron-containing alcohol dehydrogenase [Flavobacterium gawalongense]TRW99837.1 iron-containing alcohol dehydrogenase [Flavobacterium gawalongense]TRX04307.1 iron-containing alcohol dehydrogenase [Flavobacterium gawalongense]TRX06973.1 iron-containing alcohol dehydrogenase [Flavobacterium gawalongense]TRX07897.1 iron-containing alcohol dehydrogenase [Flavobacterium gawalongense]TRX24145.1 iron-containing alcohol dehydrogenase [Flavobacterium gawalongense]
MISQFNFPTTIRFGAGVIKELPEYLKKNGFKKPLLVTDPNVFALPFFKTIVADLQNAGFEPEVFYDIHKNPVKSDVYKGGDGYDNAKCDCIIGIGGGAALDVARAIALRINHREDLFKYDDLIGGDVYITNDVPTLITIPTTAGTGSEVGRSAIISDDETHQKKILFSPKLLAAIVFADPMLTMELPAFITAATGMDALTHNMEAFLAKNYHPICDGIALEGIRLISESLEKATNNPDMESRSKMLLGSMMGAIAFQKGLGVVHSLAHPLSSLLDTHHGLANAVNIPYGMRFNIAGNEDKFKRIAQTLELKEHTGEAVVQYLFDLNTKINIPHKLSAIGVKLEHIETLADLAIEDFAHPNNPKPVSREDFKKLYLEAL